MKNTQSIVRKIFALVLAFIAGCSATVRYKDHERELQLNVERGDAAADMIE